MFKVAFLYCQKKKKKVDFSFVLLCKIYVQKHRFIFCTSIIWFDVTILKDKTLLRAKMAGQFLRGQGKRLLILWKYEKSCRINYWFCFLVGCMYDK